MSSFVDNGIGGLTFFQVQDYIENEGNYVLETIEAGGEYIENPQQVGSLLGEVIYPHGLVILDKTLYNSINNSTDNIDITWKSVLPVFTTTISCDINDYEYNYTLNPTAINSFGNLKDNLLGDEFTPYITSIGLYNEENELLAVAKLSKPIKKPKSTDMVIKIKLDF